MRIHEPHGNQPHLRGTGRNPATDTHGTGRTQPNVTTRVNSGEADEGIKTLSTRLVYENPWLSLREDEIERADGSRGIYSVVDMPDFAVVIPMENDGFHLVEQYRYPLGGRYWEFPMGAFPQGETGTPEELATRELAEETGFTAGRLERLGYAHCAKGHTGQGFHVFLASGLTPGAPRREVEEQDMRQQWFPRGEVERMIRAGEITDSSTLAAYLLVAMR